MDEVAGYLGKSERTIRSMVKEHGSYKIENNRILKSAAEEKD